MKTVTDIKPQVKKPTRCNVYLDNVFYCGLELETVMKYRLKIGMQIEPSELDEIQCDSERIKAMDKALSFVSVSKKTKKQVKDHLFKKGYTQKTIDSVIEKMEDYRFIADDDYAEEYARSFSKSKGKLLIAKELKQKGVCDKDINSALDGIEDETESAVKIAEKYLKNKEKDKKNILKCYKYLLSKGFSFDTAKSAVERIGADEDDLY